MRTIDIIQLGTSGRISWTITERQLAKTLTRTCQDLSPAARTATHQAMIADARKLVRKFGKDQIVAAKQAA